MYLYMYIYTKLIEIIPCTCTSLMHLQVNVAGMAITFTPCNFCAVCIYMVHTLCKFWCTERNSERKKQQQRNSIRLKKAVLCTGLTVYSASAFPESLTCFTKAHVLLGIAEPHLHAKTEHFHLHIILSVKILVDSTVLGSAHKVTEGNV